MRRLLAILNAMMGEQRPYLQTGGPADEAGRLFFNKPKI